MALKPSAGGFASSYCTKCRLELGHTIIAMNGGIILRVKCRTCGSEHRYKSTENIKKVLTGTRKKTSTSSKVVKEKTSMSITRKWEDLMKKASGVDSNYDANMTLKIGRVISHPLFGQGVVTKVMEKKALILFKDKERILVCA